MAEIAKLVAKKVALGIGGGAVGFALGALVTDFVIDLWIRLTMNPDEIWYGVGVVTVLGTVLGGGTVGGIGLLAGLTYPWGNGATTLTPNPPCLDNGAHAGDG